MPDLSVRPDNLRDAFVAGLDWWRDAGVAEHVADEPHGWLKSREDPEKKPAAATESEPAPAPQAEQVFEKAGALKRFLGSESEGAHPGSPADWPGDLATWQKWWMESDLLDPPGAFPRVPPRGAEGAQVMLIVDQPREEDGDALLQGPAGTLAANMLRAMGIAQDARYFASALPRHNLRPDWQALATAGYGQLMVHHIALVQPKRVFACGDRVWSLLAHGTAQAPQSLTTIPLDSASIPVFAMPDLPTLLRSAPVRSQTWNRWLDWSDSPK